MDSPKGAELSICTRCFVEMPWAPPGFPLCPTCYSQQKAKDDKRPTTRPPHYKTPYHAVEEPTDD